MRPPNDVFTPSLTDRRARTDVLLLTYSMFFNITTHTTLKYVVPQLHFNFSRRKHAPRGPAPKSSWRFESSDVLKRLQEADKTDAFT